MKPLIAIFSFALFFAAPVFAREDSVLARVTVYWRDGSSGNRASWNGARLRIGHCAVDPKKIPFGSTVVFVDAKCVAVDTGPAVISRKAARLSGRTPRQREAVVVDRYFETKEQALTWAETHPHFMMLRVVGPGSSPKPVPTQSPVPIRVAETKAQQTTAARPIKPSRLVRLERRNESLSAIPPVYHRRRFALDDANEFDVRRYESQWRPRAFPEPV